jgi:hypothetical protein
MSDLQKYNRYVAGFKMVTNYMEKNGNCAFSPHCIMQPHNFS